MQADELLGIHGQGARVRTITGFGLGILRGGVFLFLASEILLLPRPLLQSQRFAEIRDTVAGLGLGLEVSSAFLLDVHRVRAMEIDENSALDHRRSPDLLPRVAGRLKGRASLLEPDNIAQNQGFVNGLRQRILAKNALSFGLC